MDRSRTAAALVGITGLINATQADGQQTCRPKLSLQNVQFSEMQSPTMERKWTAVVSVDASRCATDSAGHFEIVFVRLKEIGLDIEFRERFAWMLPTVKVAVDFWADEAVGRYWIDNITPCQCAG